MDLVPCVYLLILPQIVLNLLRPLPSLVCCSESSQNEAEGLSVFSLPTHICGCYFPTVLLVAAQSLTPAYLTKLRCHQLEGGVLASDLCAFVLSFCLSGTLSLGLSSGVLRSTLPSRSLCLFPSGNGHPLSSTGLTDSNYLLICASRIATEAEV